jgi:tetratricopeptide (TPR) repeat protein
VATAPTVPDATPAAPAAETGELARGTVFGRYVILEVLGEGGMGKVFAAHDSTLERVIALKVVRHAPDRTSQTQLVREAKAMARAAHPAIVPVHDVGAVGGRVYLAMELVRGETLRAWLAREPRTWQQIARMFVAAGRGLEAAHAAGVIHRDFKPENVLVDGSGHARVSDFGIANLTGHELGPSSAGTPPYMAPEQWTGRIADARTDQFAFCVALWQAVFGAHPFAEREEDLRRAVTSGAIVDAQGPLAPILRRGLSVDPAARWPSMTVLIAELERVLGRRRPWLPIAVLAIAVFGVVGFGVVHRTGIACDQAGARISEVWHRDAVAARLAGLDVRDRVLERLDHYAHDWAEQRVEACRATHERGEQSGALLDLRMACLDRRLGELGALIERVTPAGAAQATEALVPLSACADVASLAAVVPLPDAPAARVRVVQLRTAASAAKAELDLGHYAKGLALIEPIVAQAEAAGYAPLVAEVERIHGGLAWRADRMDAAESALYRSLASAEAGRDGEQAARTWLELLQFTSQERGRSAEALRLGKIAQGAIDRYKGDPQVASALAEQLGWIALDSEQLDEATTYLDRAYALRLENHADDHALAASLEHLGLLATEKGDHETALERHRQSLALFERSVGHDHPDTLTEVLDYGAALQQAGKLDEAAAMYRDGLARVERALGPDGLDAAMFRHNIGMVLTLEGKHDEAIALQRDALAIFRRVRGTSATDTAEQHAELARTLRAGGKLDEAIAEYRATLAEVEKAEGPRSTSAADVLVMLGRSLLEAHHGKNAIAPLERALAIREAGSDAAATKQVQDLLVEARR